MGSLFACFRQSPKSGRVMATYLRDRGVLLSGCQEKRQEHTPWLQNGGKKGRNGAFLLSAVQQQLTTAQGLHPCLTAQAILGGILMLRADSVCVCVLVVVGESRL